MLRFLPRLAIAFAPWVLRGTAGSPIAIGMSYMPCTTTRHTIPPLPPLPSVPRTIIRKVRYRPDEWATVVAHAAVHQIPPAEYIRAVSLGYTPRVRRRHPDLELVRQLLAIGNNLNQLTAVAHRTGAIAMTQAVADTLAAVLAAVTAVERRVSSDGGTEGEADQ